MENILENEVAAAKIQTLGAEIVSFKKKKTDDEYIWHGDSAYWSSHAPVLFPMVCAANDGKIKVDGKVYPIGNHGFARKSEFELIEANASKAVYRLMADENTKKMYPFAFHLYATYTLVDNQLKVVYQVENVDEKEIYFQIGTHPGFYCPVNEKTKFEDYYLEFECNETLERLFMNDANVLIPNKTEMVLQDSKVLPLTRELFAKGALVFKQVNSKKISLKCKTSSKTLVLLSSHLPYLGLWQAKDAEFVCIEPWHGIADVDGYAGEFKEKEQMVFLKPGEKFACGYTLIID